MYESAIYVIAAGIITVSAWRIILTIRKTIPIETKVQNAKEMEESKQVPEQVLPKTNQEQVLPKTNQEQVLPKTNQEQVLPKTNQEQVLPKDQPIKELSTQNISPEKILSAEDIFEESIWKGNSTYDAPSSNLFAESQKAKVDIGKLKRELLMTELEIINDELARTKKHLNEYKYLQSKKN